jgi:hypothetical protein
MLRITESETVTPAFVRIRKEQFPEWARSSGMFE